MHPYPMMVRDFQSVIGREARAQMLEQTGRLPDAVVACVGGGSNAIGIFHPFSPDDEVELDRRRGGRARHRIRRPRRHPRRRAARASSTARAPTSCRTRTARSIETHSISAGLDYPGVGPEHAYLKDTGRATLRRRSPTPRRWRASKLLCRTEGIIPALESSHAIAYAAKFARELGPGKTMLVNLSGRGDKDMHTVADALGVTL